MRNGVRQREIPRLCSSPRLEKINFKINFILFLEQENFFFFFEIIRIIPEEIKISNNKRVTHESRVIEILIRFICI